MCILMCCRHRLESTIVWRWQLSLCKFSHDGIFCLACWGWGACQVHSHPLSLYQSPSHSSCETPSTPSQARLAWYSYLYSPISPISRLSGHRYFKLIQNSRVWKIRTVFFFFFFLSYLPCSNLGTVVNFLYKHIYTAFGTSVANYFHDFSAILAKKYGFREKNLKSLRKGGIFIVFCNDC